MAAVGVDKQILLFPWKTIGQNHANNAVNVGLVNRVDLDAAFFSILLLIIRISSKSIAAFSISSNK